MKKILKVVLVFILFLAVSVKADYSSTGIVPNYTTVYQGDTITFSLGNDYLWDESLVVTDEEDDELIGELVKNEDGLYISEPFFIVIDEDNLDIDINDNKIANSNYSIVDFDKFSIDGSKKVYEFDFLIKDLQESVDAKDGYDGVIDNIMISNLKLKVHDDAEPGVYFIETFRAFNFDDTYENETYVKEYLPITVLKKDTNENKVSDITINASSNGLLENKEYSIKVENNKLNYSLLYFGEINYTNVSCKTKCLVKGIGSRVYTNIDAKDLEYKVKYQNNKEEKYKVTNLYNKLSIEYDWVTDYGKSIIYIGKDVSNADDTISEVLKHLPGFINGFKKYIYDYTKVNEYDKEVVSYLNDNIDDTYVYVIDGNQLVYSHKGEFTEDDYSNIKNEINKNKIDSGMDVESTITNCDDGICSKNKDENFNLLSFISSNFMYIVIGLCIVIILLILIITIIKKRKKKFE